MNTPVFNIGGLSVPSPVLVSAAITLVLYLLGYMALRSIRLSRPEKPRGLATAALVGIQSLDRFVETAMGKSGLWYAPFAGGLGVFLLLANLTGLLGLTPPTADILTPVALVTLVFANLHIQGVKAKGLRYARRFVEPAFFMLPLNLIGEVSNPLSMSMRLFGNMLGGSFIMTLLYQAVPVGVPVIPHLYFDVFAGVIQAYIFIMLSMTYTAVAIE